MFRSISVDQIKAFREANECGMEEALRALRRRAALAAIEDAETLTDIKRILHYMLEHKL